ncbi:MAG: caspase family protein [Bacteroidales bacterium]|nr:caspase family protein [Bacteroidales bacterium]
MKAQLLFLILISFAAGIADAQVSSGKSQSKKITFKKENTAAIHELPDLIIKEEKFVDEDQNKIINANEDCYISFVVENIGKGVAQNVLARASIKDNAKMGITFEELIELGDMGGDNRKEVMIPIQGKLNTEDGYVEFLIEVLESRGFDAFPLEFKIETRKFAEPNVVLADAVFSTEDGGNIKLNYPINLKVLVQNIGEGHARDVKVKFELPGTNCIFLGENDDYSFDYLNSGETKELDFLFTATRRYTESMIPVAVEMAESYGRYAKDTLMYVGLEENLTAKNQVVITGKPTAATTIEMASLTSDVDKNIPVVFTSKPFRYALIIGNEDYSRYQRGLNDESNVEFARNDASIFKEYAMKIFGVEEKNLFFLTDATAGEMEQKIDLISKLAAKSGQEAEILFYYAGHGLPDETSKEPYIIPVDVSGSNLNSAIKLADVYKSFSETGAQRITVFLDACFSGGGRDAGLLAARGVKVKPREEMVSGNMVVFSASSGEQSSLPYRNEQHGMFTYFLLKKLQETKGNITYGRLADFVKNQVSIESLRINSKEQDPTVQVSLTVNVFWEDWEIN